MVGLGTMGRNFLLNVAEHGFRCVGYDLDAEKRRLLVEEGAEWDVKAAEDPAEFVEMLESPRAIMLLVPAGKIVDSVIEDLLPHLQPGDIIIDGGNSHFTDTERREIYVTEKGFGFLGVGVSGGEEGARRGPSIMPGGHLESYRRVAPIFEAVAAKVDGVPCVAYMGRSSAGHFVKMVHNGIEYGLMQIIAETYDLMQRVLKMDYAAMSKAFADWNNSKLNSFLIEITAEVLRKTDAETGRPLVEMILDKAAQKGTGKWTSQAAMDLGVPIPTIDAAVSMRQISAQKDVRAAIAEKYGALEVPASAAVNPAGEDVESSEQHDRKASMAAEEAKTAASEHANAAVSGDNGQVRTQIDDADGDIAVSLEKLKNTLLSSFIVTYTQGMSMLQIASTEMDLGLDLASIARIWRGGCIIRSSLLEEIRGAFENDPAIANLLLDDGFAQLLERTREDWHETAGKFSASRVPSLCVSSALSYFEAFRSERLPANLIQAQRDFFGAHTYQRVDKEGIFHTPDWEK